LLPSESYDGPARAREFFIDNLLVRNHFIIVMIRWTGLAPWEFELRHRYRNRAGHVAGVLLRVFDRGKLGARGRLERDGLVRLVPRPAMVS